MFDQYIEEEQISQNLLNNGYIIQLPDKISKNSCKKIWTYGEVYCVSWIFFFFFSSSIFNRHHLVINNVIHFTHFNKKFFFTIIFDKLEVYLVQFLLKNTNIFYWHKAAVKVLFVTLWHIGKVHNRLSTV